MCYVFCTAAFPTQIVRFPAGSATSQLWIDSNDDQATSRLLKLDKVNCARLRWPYGGLGGSVQAMGEWSVDTGFHEVSENIWFV